MKVKEKITIKKKWIIRRYENDVAYAEDRPYSVSVFEENVLLNEGITVALQLICGIAATAFSNANAYLGVGDSATAEAAAQTGLQAAVNKLYKAMSATYPQVAAQTATWRAAFTGAEANFAWNEFSVANGNSDAATNLNRKVSAQGTKTAGQTWTLDLAITLS